MKITVFTPTYNRGYIIEKLYDSLKRQTCKDFEWLVVDDGSEDNTEELFAGWMAEDNGFPIRYYKKENGGKHRAINYALDLAEGELFFTVDSDDYLTEDAVEKVIGWEGELSKEEKYCAFAGNMGTSASDGTNNVFDGGCLDGTLLDRYGKVNGERALVFYTDIHRRYKYPEYDGEKFMTEAVVWNRMSADGYKCRYYNDIIWIYEYQADGLTKTGSALFANNPRGYGLWLREKSDIMKENSYKKLKMHYSFLCEMSLYYDDTVFIADCIGMPHLLARTIVAIRRLFTHRREK